MNAWPIIVLMCVLVTASMFLSDLVYRRTPRRLYLVVFAPMVVIECLAIGAMTFLAIGIWIKFFWLAIMIGGLLLAAAVALWIAWRRYLIRKHGFDPIVPSLTASFSLFLEDKKEATSMAVTILFAITVIVTVFVLEPGNILYGTWQPSGLEMAGIFAFALLCAGDALLTPERIRRHPYARIASLIFYLPVVGYLIAVGLGSGGLFHIFIGMFMLAVFVGASPKLIRDLRKRS